jgi:hypothetical protein
VAATTIAITSRRVIAKVLSLPTNLREDGKNLRESAQELGDALTINATFLDERHHLKKSRGRKTSSVAPRDAKGRSSRRSPDAWRRTFGNFRKTIRCARIVTCLRFPAALA